MIARLLCLGYLFFILLVTFLFYFALLSFLSLLSLVLLLLFQALFLLGLCLLLLLLLLSLLVLFILALRLLLILLRLLRVAAYLREAQPEMVARMHVKNHMYIKEYISLYVPNDANHSFDCPPLVGSSQTSFGVVA